MSVKAKGRKQFIRFGAILALLGQGLAVPAVAGAAMAGPTLAEKVPGDSVFYLGWNGADPAYETSKLAGLLKAFAVKDLFDTKIPAMMKKEGADESAIKDYREGLEVTRKVLQKPIALYVKKPKEGTEEPEVGVFVDAGADAESLMAAMKRLDKSGGEMKSERIGNLIWVGTVAPPKMEAGASLMEAAKFLGAGASKGDTSFVSVYLDTASLLAAAVKEEPQAGPILEALGLMEVKSFMGSGRFDKGDWVSELGVAMPGGGKGLVKKLFAPVPAAEREAALALVPSDATSVSLLSFDPVGWSDEAITAIKPMVPDAHLMRIRVISGLTVMTGVNLKDDLFEALSPTWTTYNMTGGRFVVVNQPRKPELAARSVTKLMQAGMRLAASQQARGIPAVTVEAVDAGQTEGVAVMVMKVAEFSLAWGSKDGALAFAGTPADVVAALKKPADGGMAKSPKLGAMAARLNVPAGAVGDYNDLPRSFPAFYDTLLEGVQELQAQIDQVVPNSGFKLAEWLPAKEAIVPLMTEAAGASWVDDSGWHYRSVSPFPGAGMNSFSTVGVGSTAMAVSILLPSLNRARETANRVKCASNLRQIGQACLLHSNENLGKYPGSIGEILKQDIEWTVFECPSENEPRPPAEIVGDTAKLGDWLTEKGNYVYVGAGQTNAAEADVVVAYEKDGAHDKDGRNVLFADGRVEFIMEKDFAGVLVKGGPESELAKKTKK